MKASLAEFSQNITRFGNRVTARQANPLSDPAQDTDDRAALAILMTAAFERFLGDATHGCVDALSKTGVAFAALPSVIQHWHLSGGADAIRDEVRDRKKNAGPKSPDYRPLQNLCDRLASVWAAPPHQLVWEGFAKTNSNPGPDTVRDILKRLSVEKPWATIASNVANPYPGLPEDAVSNKLVHDLRELVRARNRCAHGGFAVAAPGYSVILEYLAAVQAIAVGLTKVLEDKVADVADVAAGV